MALKSASFFLLIPVLVVSVGCEEPTEHSKVTTNPYKDVDWPTWNRHTVNLHTHTTESDGRLSPAEVIDAYKELGYAALSITDHNKYTWPWNTWDRDTLNEGVVAIPGCEPSRHDHVNSFFCDYAGESGNIEVTLDSISSKGGLAQINHPGRYDRSPSWYENLYTRYPMLISMEVYNQGDRYSGDRRLWDEVLSRTMPARPIWATSNDDMHKADHIGRNRQIVLTADPQPTLESVRESLEEGRFFAGYDPSGTAENLIIPDSIYVHPDTIRIYAPNTDADIRWIGIRGEIHSGNELVLSEEDTLGNYVRAEIRGPGGARLLLQPFGLEHAVSTSSSAPSVPRSKVSPEKATGRHHVIIDKDNTGKAHSLPVKDTRGRTLPPVSPAPGLRIRE